jgi:hypothetical protein
MPGDPGTTNYSLTEGLLLPSSPSTTKETDTGDGNTSKFNFFRHLLGFIEAIRADLVDVHKPNPNAHHNRQHDMASGADHTVTADVDFGTHKAKSSAVPTSGSDLVNKTYADALALGFTQKHEAVVVSTSNQALSGLPTVDGVTLTDGQTILLTAQTTGSQNGLWAVHAGAWTRPSFFATGDDASGSFVFIQRGTNFVSSGWTISGASPITIDTTAQTWTQFSGLGEVTAGAGMTKSGSTLNVGANADGSIAVNSDDIQVADAGVVAGKVAKSLFDANTILKADADDTPVALAVAASTLLGRKSSGGIAALTPTEALALLGGLQAPTVVGAVVSHTGDGTETTLASHTVPQGGLGTKGYLKVQAMGITAGSGTCHVRLYWGSTVIHDAFLTDPWTWWFDAVIAYYNSDQASWSCNFRRWQGNTPRPVSTPNVNFVGDRKTGTLDLSAGSGLLKVTGQLISNTADTVTLDQFVAEPVYVA